MRTPHILVFNGTRRAAEARLVDAGSKSYDQLIRESLDRHLPADTRPDYFTLRVADGERFPRGLGIDDFDGVWISGSPLNAYELDQPSVRAQIELVRAIWQAGIPAFGSCWGLQVMTAALGGTVRLNPKGREIGVARRISLTDAGRVHPMFVGKRNTFDALCTHEDEVGTLPACAQVLASNEVSDVQAAVFRDGERCFWGAQYHPEFEFSTVAAIISTYAQRHIDEGLARADEDVRSVIADYAALDGGIARTDLAWKYGVGADVLDPARRTAEFRNWLYAEVLPRAGR